MQMQEKKMAVAKNDKVRDKLSILQRTRYPHLVFRLPARRQTCEAMGLNLCQRLWLTEPKTGPVYNPTGGKVKIDHMRNIKIAKRAFSRMSDEEFNRLREGLEAYALQLLNLVDPTGINAEASSAP
ncbi:hypothetical protein SPFM10_00061 [Salmonella phage SPFM10]|nr:hypothetical protein SPFM6_00058 [Salmonella phage SPFM6]VFR12305.1 hypothetical protein SPFM10_00061 [Salmonella phage SPFM10]